MFRRNMAMDTAVTDMAMEAMVTATDSVTATIHTNKKVKKRNQFLAFSNQRNMNTDTIITTSNYLTLIVFFLVFFGISAVSYFSLLKREEFNFMKKKNTVFF